jgi:glycosidase
LNKLLNPTINKISRFSLGSFALILILSAIVKAQSHHDWSYNLGMYEVNVRQYTQEGTFAAFETHLERLQELGVGILWFMPIHPIGTENRLGSLGSYYSVKDYYDVNPEFGTLEEFKALVEKAHDMGFYVIIDWVANHTSWDNQLTVTNPDWYTKDGNGNFISPVGTNWTDVIDLDYSKQGLRDYMIDAMSFWITEVNVDGFRCDAASWVPLDFWQTAIAELKNLNPEILMLAEADGKEFHGAGFDMTFAWGLYGFGHGVLTNIVDGSYNANYLASYIRGELKNFSDKDFRLYFTSNHDENSWHGTVFERFGDAAEAFAAITLTINSMPLIYSGQEAGLNKRLQFFDKDQIVWTDHPLNNVYKNLLELKRKNRALWNSTSNRDDMRVLTNNNPDIYAFVREVEENKVFALFNLTDQNQTVLPEGEVFKGSYKNVFTGDTNNFIAGTEINLDPWGYVIYDGLDELTHVTKNEILNNNYSLSQNYPNPFNPTTRIKYKIPINVKRQTSNNVGTAQELSLNTINVELKIYSLLGREIATLVNQKQKPGTYEVEFNGSHFPSGVYFYKIIVGDYSDVKKMMLMK